MINVKLLVFRPPYKLALTGHVITKGGGGGGGGGGGKGGGCKLWL